MRMTIPLIVLLALAGCGGDKQSGPGEVTGDEARALNDAAAMIEERRMSEEKAPVPAPSPS